MKKIILLFVFSLAFVSNAQVVNGDFEVVKPNFLASNWGMNFNIPVSMDPVTGQNSTDVIQYSSCIPSMCNATTEAFSGNGGLEISNALNTNQNTVIKGYAMAFADATQDSPGWQPGLPIDVGMNVNMLGFQYKFFPVGTEIGQAVLTIYNQDSAIMGTAEIDLTATTDNNFHYIYAPVNFIETGTPVWMYIYITMAKDGTNPTYGSRMVIDNIIVNSALLANNSFKNDQFAIYPTLVENEINITKGTALSGDYKFEIVNLEGRIINQKTINLSDNETSKIDVSQLSSGIYLIKTEGYIAKFVKK